MTTIEIKRALATVTKERDEALHAVKLLQCGDSDGSEYAHVVALKVELDAVKLALDKAERECAALRDVRDRWMNETYRLAHELEEAGLGDKAKLRMSDS